MFELASLRSCSEVDSGLTVCCYRSNFSGSCLSFEVVFPPSCPELDSEGSCPRRSGSGPFLDFPKSCPDSCCGSRLKDFCSGPDSSGPSLQIELDSPDSCSELDSCPRFGLRDRSFGCSELDSCISSGSVGRCP